MQPIASPTKKEQFTLRLMITLGLISMFFFIDSVLVNSIKGYPPLYWMLITTFVFTCLKTLHEWCHYFWITVPPTPAKTKIYTVDIFTTFCAGEPYEMIEETLKAIQAITYPHETYLCDEANDPYLKTLCKELNIHHITRVKKIDAKAGNINNALKYSTGELCVILDPDHVPFPNFLDPIVSHFNNPEIGFVQIVQAYKNNGDSLIAKGAAQQTYQFYGPMMMTMNKFGTVLAIGANCTFRRSALESIGGHAAGLAEDMHTAMQLHAKGWKSVYVPQILARGLVPSTLSAYYQQQLKWSRGVFDLLMNVYPKLFRGFSWQQKIHYAAIPMHYLSGIIYLINFLIPIVSLFLDLSPIRMNITDFGLAILPFIVSTLMIRHFVQWWVMEDNERGFHVLGGLLIIGTWWVFILGVVYTLIGKKIPYIPTPKDGKETNNWRLNIPNILMLCLSLTAIVYGLSFDWNPYNLIMAGFAGLNSIILIFNIAASKQQQLRLLQKRYFFANALMAGLKKTKTRFWLLRRRIYTGIRSTALLITIILCAVVLYFAKQSEEGPTIALPVLDHKTQLFLTGIFSPINFDGNSSIHNINKDQLAYNVHFDIISLYIPWGEQAQCYLPHKTIDSIYNQGSIPMITWEPWQTLFTSKESKKDEKVFKKILAGAYDTYLNKFSQEIKALNKPVYIRFAHEMDNPAYPWSLTGHNSPEEFKAAWKYVHSFFAQQQVYQAIWVWNPWKAEAANAYFPGEQFVDWIGVTLLNYGPIKDSAKWTSMYDLYKPFHQNPIFQSGLPVMLAEMGSYVDAGRQAEWLAQAFKAKDNFKEIKAFVFFDSKFDKNVPDGTTGSLLDWTIQQPDSLKTLLQEYHPNKQSKRFDETPSFIASYPPPSSLHHDSTNSSLYLQRVRGINYNRAQDWKKNYHTITMFEILSDFKEMKQLGVNAIKRYGPDIYDRNIMKAARMNDMGICYGYWISDEINFFSDKNELHLLQYKILKSVRSLKEEPCILAWNIGNTVFQKLSIYYHKPELLYQQDAYLTWLKDLVLNIKKIDPTRPITIDVAFDANMESTIERIKNLIPEIDAYGIVTDAKAISFDAVEALKVPYFFSDMQVSVYNRMRNNDVGTFITSWQDEQKIDQVTVNGIKDYRGRKKLLYSELYHRWGQGPLPAPPPLLKVLKPALGTYEGSQLDYHILIKQGNEWNLASEGQDGWNFEWYLVKVNRFEKPISMEHVADGIKLTLSIPKTPEAYRLYVYASKGGQILDIIKSPLNTPLNADE